MGERSGTIAAICWAVVLGAIVAFVAFNVPAVRSGLCIAGDDYCFREWLGALNGYFGGIFAAIAALLVYQQIQSQREDVQSQIAESRLQFEANYRLQSHELRAQVRLSLRSVFPTISRLTRISKDNSFSFIIEDVVEAAKAIELPELAFLIKIDQGEIANAVSMLRTDLRSFSIHAVMRPEDAARIFSQNEDITILKHRAGYFWNPDSENLLPTLCVRISGSARQTVEALTRLAKEHNIDVSEVSAVAGPQEAPEFPEPVIGFPKCWQHLHPGSE